MSSIVRLMIAIKALCQLGLQPLALYGLYRLGLQTGFYRRVEHRSLRVKNNDSLQPLLLIPPRHEILRVLGKKGRTALLAEADEITAGRFHLFGGDPLSIHLTFNNPLGHWTDYETGKMTLPSLDAAFADIKYIWEPARFGWAFMLGRAYHVSGREKYVEAFWRYVEQFLDGNPPYLGPHWISGQEVTLRLMAFVWAAQVFAASPHSTPERMARLAQAVAAHASRIPPTLVYARSQNNNHLLTEAAGLYTAGLALPGHPQSAKWQSLGWRWLNWGFQKQIDSYGEYTQHSTNYHRLMLQVALWVNAITRCDRMGRRYPKEVLDALSRATHWLVSLLDLDSGQAPNLGANDGAYIFPLTVCPFEDYRPVVQAASRAFLGHQLPEGVWDEMSLWLGARNAAKSFHPEHYLSDNLHGKNSWAYLRTVRFTSRPSHADLLHLDLWWRGLNIAQDAGSYLYNGHLPWDNALTTSQVHNTVIVNGRDQMTRAGRFLYLDWTNAYRKSHIEVDEHILQRVSAHHQGYRRLGVCHERVVTIFSDERWQVEDDLLVNRMPWTSWTLLTFRLHWLLPDWKWEIENRDSGKEIYIDSPDGKIVLSVVCRSPLPGFESHASLVRAGELLYGSSVPSPIMGWVSPTYGCKIPALSFTMEVIATHDVKFISEFIFPK